MDRSPSLLQPPQLLSEEPLREAGIVGVLGHGVQLLSDRVFLLPEHLQDVIHFLVECLSHASIVASEHFRGKVRSFVPVRYLISLA